MEEITKKEEKNEVLLRYEIEGLRLDIAEVKEAMKKSNTRIKDCEEKIMSILDAGMSFDKVQIELAKSNKILKDGHLADIIVRVIDTSPQRHLSINKKIHAALLRSGVNYFTPTMLKLSLKGHGAATNAGRYLSEMAETSLVRQSARGIYQVLDENEIKLYDEGIET